jgi:hypothetical protein
MIMPGAGLSWADAPISVGHQAGVEHRRAANRHMIAVAGATLVG